MPRKVELWDRMELAWQDPTYKEIKLWNHWRNKAERWKPDRQSQYDDMEDWGTIFETLNMQAVLRGCHEPVVFRTFNEMRKRSRDLCELFGEPFEKPEAE